MDIYASSKIQRPPSIVLFLLVTKEGNIEKSEGKKKTEPDVALILNLSRNDFHFTDLRKKKSSIKKYTI